MAAQKDSGTRKSQDNPNNRTHQLPDCVSEFFDEDSFYKDTSQQAKYQPGFGKYVLDRPITPDWSKIKEENLHGLKDIPHASQVLTAKRSPSTDYDDEETLEVLQSLADASQEYDSYSLATSDEEEMAKLIDPVSPVTRQQHIPPSSVLRGLGTPSTIETFDPNLQRSPPTNTPSKMTQGCPTSGGSRGNEEELLDYDVDWDIILNSPPSLPKDPSLFGSSNKDMIAAAPGEPTVGKEFSSSRPPQSIQKPFVRPPFPQTMRDKSPVIGLSNSSMLRTCFRIGQLVNEGARCFSTQKDVTFELYARIMSSSREPFSRVQHFRFMDLFKEQLPYPTGTLTGWKMGSLLDRQCSVFLTGAQQQQTKRMCRCICKLKKEGKTEKTELGWTISVLDIREVDWVEIDVIKRIVCRK
ncbi:hypothetical protein B0H63DRAFT_524030 [Podospora didyma]|uniref:Uncharacterized protein n=1 Tax=Podospora didyma TaxID=330526 RepID=A0AAE0NGU1_9PEZI|nr:hypothetical protein B0H63DRAFT_524030 [Podospora didyma]